MKETSTSAVQELRGKKVLILNGASKNGLAVTRSLGKRGLICDITADGTNRPVFGHGFRRGLLSRYVRNYHLLPPFESEDQFVEALAGLLESQHYDYLLTAGTRSYNLAAANKTRLQQYTNVLVEDAEKVATLHDKISCRDLAISLGIATPMTYAISCREDLEKAAAAIDYPVVVKYPDSYASLGLWTFECGGQALVDAYLERCPELDDTAEQKDMPIIQERIDGPLVDVTAFTVDGTPWGLLSQERLVTAWLDGGGGICNVTTDVPEIRDMAAKLLEAVRWTGHIEMDFIRDEKNENYRLLEVNPKFWGTTQLTISAGFDFPYWAVCHAAGIKPNLPKNYRVGLMYRWLIDEMAVILTVPKTRTRLLKELGGYFKRFGHRPVETELYLSDLRPAFFAFINVSIRLIRRGILLNSLGMLLLGRSRRS